MRSAPVVIRKMKPRDRRQVSRQARTPVGVGIPAVEGRPKFLITYKSRGLARRTWKACATWNQAQRAAKFARRAGYPYVQIERAGR